MPPSSAADLELLGQVELEDRALADDVGARQAEHLLRAGVPDADDAVAVGADDRLLGDRVDDAGHRLGAGGEHAGGEVELVGAGLHLGQQDGALVLEPLDAGRLAAEPAGGLVDPEAAQADGERAEQQGDAERAGGGRRRWRAGRGEQDGGRAQRRRARTPRRPGPATSARTGASARTSTAGDAVPADSRPTAPRCSTGTTTATSPVAAGRATSRATSVPRNAEARPASTSSPSATGSVPVPSRTAATAKSTVDGSARSSDGAPAGQLRGAGAAEDRGARLDGGHAGCLAVSARTWCTSPDDLERLGQVGVGTGGQARGDVVQGGAGRQQQDADAGGRRVGAQRGADLQAGRAGHGDVEDGEVGQLGAREVQRGGAVGDRADDGAAGLAHGERHEGADVVLVVGDQHADGATRRRPRWLPVDQGSAREPGPSSPRDNGLRTGACSATRRPHPSR